MALLQLLVSPVLLPLAVAMGVPISALVILYDLAMGKSLQRATHDVVLIAEIGPLAWLWDSYWIPLYHMFYLPPSPLYYCLGEEEEEAEHVGDGGVVVVPPKKGGMERFVFLSDTHGKHTFVDVPDGDVLVHTGDAMCRNGECFGCCTGAPALAASFGTWLASHPHPLKIFIPGNHDAVFEVIDDKGRKRKGVRREGLLPESIVTLFGDTVVTPGGLKVWGAPLSNPSRSSNSAFQWPKDSIATQALIRDALRSPPPDIVLTHGNVLRSVAQRAKLHAFGHFHEGYGVSPATARHPVVKVNSSLCTSSYLPLRQPIVVDIPTPKPKASPSVMEEDGSGEVKE